MAAITGNGTQFKWDTDDVGQVQSISGPSMSVATIDTTDIAGTSKTFIAGMVDGGEISVEVSYDPDTVSMYHSAMTTDLAVGTEKAWEIVWSDGSKVGANGILTSFSASASIDDKVTASYAIKVSGAVTFTPLS